MVHKQWNYPVLLISSWYVWSGNFLWCCFDVLVPETWGRFSPSLAKVIYQTPTLLSQVLCTCTVPTAVPYFTSRQMRWDPLGYGVPCIAYIGWSSLQACHLSVPIAKCSPWSDLKVNLWSSVIWMEGKSESRSDLCNQFSSTEQNICKRELSIVENCLRDLEIDLWHIHHGLFAVECCQWCCDPWERW